MTGIAHWCQSIERLSLERSSVHQDHSHILDLLSMLQEPCPAAEVPAKASSSKYT